MMLSVGRIIGLGTYYSAPQKLLQSLELPKGNLCMENSWYRYPGSFYIGNDVRPRFIKGSFDGLLPIPFEEGPDSYRSSNNSLNGYNRAIPEQFISANACSSFMGTREEFSRHFQRSEAEKCELLIDPSNSPAPYRWMRIPGMYAKVKFTEFCVWTDIHVHAKV